MVPKDEWHYWARSLAGPIRAGLVEARNMTRALGRFFLATAVAFAACNEPFGSSGLPAPLNVVAYPGPGLNQITVTGEPTPATGRYWVYWGRTPGFTRRPDSSGLAQNGLFEHTGLPPNTTYYYVMTSIDVNNHDAEGPASPETHATTSENIGLRIESPVPGALGGSEITVAVRVISRYQIAQVTEKVGGQTVGVGGGGFVQGTLVEYYGSTLVPLGGSPNGPLTVTVEATDVFANVVSGSVVFVHGEPPTLTILAPESLTVARPTLRVAASCLNEDLKGCASLTVSVGSDQPGGGGLLVGPPIARGQATIDQIVSLAAYEGQGHTLVFQGTDSAGRVMTAYRPVFVESSPLLTEVASVHGAILDVQPDRILFLTQWSSLVSVPSSNSHYALAIHDRASGVDVVIYDQAGHLPRRGYLTPLGAMFIERDTHTIDELHEWRSGVLSALGRTCCVVVKGRYAFFDTGVLGSIKRDVVADVNTPIGGAPGDVASNGDVVYANYQIYRFRNGVTTQLTNDSPLWNIGPKTDGVSVVYAKGYNPYGKGLQLLPIALYDDGGEHILSTTHIFSTTTTYEVTDGWVVYDKAGQIWTRSPAGVERTTQFTTASTFEAIGPSGEMVVRLDRRYYTVPDYRAPPRDISSGLGTAFFQNGTLFITIGRTLFQVNP